MNIDFQVILNLFSFVFSIGFSIGLIMIICEKIAMIFQDFVIGRNRVRL